MKALTFFKNIKKNGSESNDFDIEALKNSVLSNDNDDKEPSTTTSVGPTSVAVA